MEDQKEIKTEDIKSLIKSLGSAKFDIKSSFGHTRIPAFGDIENNNYKFRAWRDNEGACNEQIKSRLILYRPSFGLSKDEEISTKGLELQTRYTFFGGYLIHNFVESDLRDKWYGDNKFELGRYDGTDFVSVCRGPGREAFEESRKAHKQIVSFTNPGGSFNSSWLPEDERLLRLFDLENKISGYYTRSRHKRDAIYEVLNAYSSLAIRK